MLFSEEEMIVILKKHLPDVPSKDLEYTAKSIIDESKHWQEVDLHHQMHDKEEIEILHNICHRHSKEKKPKHIRLFFKH